MLRFGLRTIFVFLTICGVALGYCINFNCVHTKCRFCLLPGGDALALTTIGTEVVPEPGPTASQRELAEQTIEYVNSEDFLSNLLNQPDVRNLAAFQGKEYPIRWLRQRLRFRHTGSESIMKVDLVHYTHVDRDSVFDRPIILSTMLRMIDEEVCSRYPQPRGISRCHVYVLQMPVNEH